MKKMTENLWEYNKFLWQNTDKNFLVRTGKGKHWNAICESYEQPVSS